MLVAEVTVAAEVAEVRSTHNLAAQVTVTACTDDWAM
jgi:hypothetical protein